MVAQLAEIAVAYSKRYESVVEAQKMVAEVDHIPSSVVVLAAAQYAPVSMQNPVEDDLEWCARMGGDDATAVSEGTRCLQFDQLEFSVVQDAGLLAQASLLNPDAALPINPKRLHLYLLVLALMEMMVDFDPRLADA